MAIARKCDRCGEFYEKYKYSENNFSVHQLNDRYTWILRDLCPKCDVDLNLWMQGKAEFVLKEVTDDGINRV